MQTKFSSILSRGFARRLDLLADAGLIDVAQLDALLTAIHELLGRQLFKSPFDFPASPRQVAPRVSFRASIPRCIHVFDRTFRTSVARLDGDGLPELQRGRMLVDAIDRWLEIEVFEKVLYRCTESDCQPTTPQQMLDQAAALVRQFQARRQAANE